MSTLGPTLLGGGGNCGLNLSAVHCLVAHTARNSCCHNTFNPISQGGRGKWGTVCQREPLDNNIGGGGCGCMSNAQLFEGIYYVLGVR